MNRSFQNVFGTRIQENFGKNYLTFWEGEKGDGIGDGYGLAYDDNYRLAYKVSAQNIKVHSDLHEFAFTGHGTALVTGVDKVLARGSDYKDWAVPDVFEILDGIVQEIELGTNKVLFNWRALDHIDPMDSFEPRGSGWDAYHLNSIEKTKAGNYLISLRHLHSILLIDGKSGEIIWTLGGNRNDFVELPPLEGVEYSQPLLTLRWQHHARFVPGTDETQMTLFDNHVRETSHGQCDSECSRGLHIAIDDTSSPPTVRLLREFRHPSQLQAQSQGSVQVLSPSPKDLGNVFIGWGRCPTFTEHNATGQTVLDVQFSPWHSPDVPDALDNYRAYKMDWSATPWWDPAIAARKSWKGELVVYVSWNGATEVANWVVRGAAHDLHVNRGEVLAESRRTGFETKLTVGKTVWRYLWAEAMDHQGNILRSTSIVDLDTEELSVASDIYGEFDSAIPIKQKAAGLSKTAFVLIATVSGILVFMISAGGAILWRRCNDYNRLEPDDFDLDMGEEDDSENDNTDATSKLESLSPQSREDDAHHALLPRIEERKFRVAN
ncbi:arylsulfotransferase [Penicillium canariense]|uniref:Arylsulfotransferase n=1 Tax=Penicillium canariense TaxID=189055 RepID=A0A9W9IEE6_9EURO|nr:arylsulfotransferase [Penicillium canariense]KAJ5175680.1 arylsulfotransferase [Penicillium canariense]